MKGMNVRDSAPKAEAKSEGRTEVMASVSDTVTQPKNGNSQQMCGGGGARARFINRWSN